MLMLDEDDLDDRLYDMDAVWSDHEHEKHKMPPNNVTAKKVWFDFFFPQDDVKTKINVY